MLRKKISLQIYIGGFLMAALIALVVYNMRDVWFGTPLHISTVTDGTTVDSVVFPISGSASHAKKLTINGREVGIDLAGKFNDEVVLSKGYNMIEVTLADKFGKQKTQILHVVANDSSSLAQATTQTYQP